MRQRLIALTRSGVLPLALALLALAGLWLFRDGDASARHSRSLPDRSTERAAAAAAGEEEEAVSVEDLAAAYPMIDRSALEVIAEIKDGAARRALLERARERFEAQAAADAGLYPPEMAIGPAVPAGDGTSPFDDGRDALGGLPPVEAEPDCGARCWKAWTEERPNERARLSASHSVRRCAVRL